MSVVPHQELWSQIHSLWLLSTMLPKFGGANIAAIIAHNHDQNLRFIMLFLESMVFLQFCGVRRLDIASRMMTGRECSVFVKVCLASVLPVITITFISAKLVSVLYEDGHYPVWIYAVMTWFDLVQLSCIPVFAIVFMNKTKMNIDNCLLPLPTWVPVNWEHVMYYRKTLVVEGFDTDARKRPRGPPRAQPTVRPSSKKPAKSSSDSSSSSSTEFLGSAFVVPSDRLFVQPRSDILRRSRQPKPAASSGVASLSGTVHMSRHMSSVRRSVIRGRHLAEAPDQADKKDRTSKTTVATVREGVEPSDMAVHSSPALEEVTALPEGMSPSLAQQGEKVQGPQGSPERSIVPPEVYQVGDVEDEHQYADVHPLEPQTALARADIQPVTEDEDDKVCARKTATEECLVPLASCEAILPSHNKNEGKLTFPQKLKHDGEVSASRGAKMPGVVESAHLPHMAAMNAQFREAVYDKVVQAHLPSSAISMKPRRSVEEILVQNEPLPFSPSEGGLVSDMHVRVFGEPAAPTPALAMLERGKAAGGKRVANVTVTEKKPERKASSEHPKKQAEAEQCALSGLRSGEQPSKAKAATPAKRTTRKHRHLRRRKPKQPVNKVTPADGRVLAEVRGTQPRQEANLPVENVQSKLGRREKSREDAEKHAPEELAFKEADMSAALQPSLFPHQRDRAGARASQAVDGKNIFPEEHEQAIVVSMKPRLSVHEMLLQNKALPISPTEGGILSDMYIRVYEAPGPASHSKPPVERGKQLSAGHQHKPGLWDARDPKTRALAAAGSEEAGEVSPKILSATRNLSFWSSKCHPAKHEKRSPEEDADQRRKAASGGPVLLASRASGTRSPTGATNIHQRAKSVADSITLPPERFATSAVAKPKIAGHDAKIKMSSKSLDFPKKVSATHVRTSLVPVKSSEGKLLPKTSRKPAESTSPSRSSRKSSTAANNRVAEEVHERLATKEALSTRTPTAVSKEAYDAPDVIPDAHHSRAAPSSPAKAQKAGDKKKKKLKKGNSPDASCLPVRTTPAPAQDPRQVNTPRK